MKRARELKPTMETQTLIERFLVEEILVGTREALGATEPLVGPGGLLDSLGLLRLIQFLEETFQIRVGDGDVGEEHFGTLERLARFVDSKRAEGERS
jgi:acyl carrier protein